MVGWEDPTQGAQGGFVPGAGAMMVGKNREGPGW